MNRQPRNYAALLAQTTTPEWAFTASQNFEAHTEGAFYAFVSGDEAGYRPFLFEYERLRECYRITSRLAEIDACLERLEEVREDLHPYQYDAHLRKYERKRDKLRGLLMSVTP